MNTPLAEHFANWGATLNVAQIPFEVLEVARHATLDLIGVMACGSLHPTVGMVRATFAEMPGPCTVVGGSRSSASAAALVNGIAAHVWDFDDNSYTGLMHASAVVFPAVLAAAEEAGRDHEYLLTAFIVGSEVAYTLGETLSYSHYFKGWWSTATLGLIGATAGVARAYGLDAKTTAQAIGMAAAGAGATKCVFGTDSKPMFVGEVASRAINFCKAAAAGLTGPVGAFEDSRGFVSLLNDHVFQGEMPGTLGKRWRLHDPGLLIKLNPVCSAAHAVIEATSHIIRTNHIAPAQIARIHCRVPALVSMSLVFDRPDRPQQAQFSLPYAVACAVLYGRVGLKDLEPAALTTVEKRWIMGKVEYETDPELSADSSRGRHPESARVAITLDSGEMFEAYCGEAYGMPRRPLKAEHLWEKFESCTAFAGVASADLEMARSLLTADTNDSGSILDVVRTILEGAEGSITTSKQRAELA